MLEAVLAHGDTVLRNVARDRKSSSRRALNDMGCAIEGAAETEIRIKASLS